MPPDFSFEAQRQKAFSFFRGKLLHRYAPFVKKSLNEIFFISSLLLSSSVLLSLLLPLGEASFIKNVVQKYFKHLCWKKFYFIFLRRQQKL